MLLVFTPGVMALWASVLWLICVHRLRWLDRRELAERCLARGEVAVAAQLLCGTRKRGDDHTRFHLALLYAHKGLFGQAVCMLEMMRAKGGGDVPSHALDHALACTYAAASASLPNATALRGASHCAIDSAG